MAGCLISATRLRGLKTDAHSRGGLLLVAGQQLGVGVSLSRKTHDRAMSALPPIANIDEGGWHVRFVP
jgi:hypothetical protein